MKNGESSTTSSTPAATCAIASCSELEPRPSPRRSPNDPLPPPLRKFDGAERIGDAVELRKPGRHDGRREKGRRATLRNVRRGVTKGGERALGVGAHLGERRPQLRRVLVRLDRDTGDAVAVEK